MKQIARVLLLLTCSLSLSAQPTLRLWYKQPAALWTEALPVGNGRVGAMIFGKVDEELIQLNESTLWSGGPVTGAVNPEAPSFLPRIRQALAEEKYKQATELAKRMQGLYTQSYLPLGDLILKQASKGTPITAYYRDLDLKRAVARTRFTVNGTEYVREIFSSAPDQLMVIRLTASKPGQISFDAATRSQLRVGKRGNGTSEWIMSGKAPTQVDPNYYNPKDREHVVYDNTQDCKGMRFQLRLKALNKGGTVQTDTAGLHVRNATEVLCW